MPKKDNDQLKELLIQALRKPNSEKIMYRQDEQLKVTYRPHTGDIDITMLSVNRRLPDIKKER